MEVEFTNACANTRGNKVPRMPAFDDEASFHQHFAQAFFTEVFRNEIFLAVPQAEFFRGVFRKKTVHGKCQLSAWLENAKTFAQGRLRAAEMLEAIDTDHAVECVIVKAKVFGEALHVVGPRPIRTMLQSASQNARSRNRRRCRCPTMRHVRIREHAGATEQIRGFD